jgi:hypothetical protein
MTEEILQNQAAPTEIAQQSMAMAQEKMLPQSEVNELAGRIRAEAYEKAKRELQSANPVGAQQVAQGAMSEEQIRRLIDEQTTKIQQQHLMAKDAERIVSEFATKMDLGKEVYEDFDDSVRELDLRAIPEIVQLANSVGNTAEVMYDLAKNPYKIANLKVLAQTSPHLAKKEMQRLSASIDSNKAAASQVNTRTPVSQMKPSTGLADSGPGMSLKDFKRAHWARG